jgi:hypothetical protein
VNGNLINYVAPRYPLPPAAQRSFQTMDIASKIRRDASGRFARHRTAKPGSRFCEGFVFNEVVKPNLIAMLASLEGNVAKPAIGFVPTDIFSIKVFRDDTAATCRRTES